MATRLMKYTGKRSGEPSTERDGKTIRKGRTAEIDPIEAIALLKDRDPVSGLRDWEPAPRPEGT